LTEQLVRAEKSDGKLQAWFRLTPNAVDIAKTPEKIEAIALATLNRVKQQTGEEPESVTVQPYLGAFTVSGSFATPSI
jgi:hypothetical protein